MPVNQPPISNDPAEAAWSLEVTELLNELETLLAGTRAAAQTSGTASGDGASSVEVSRLSSRVAGLEEDIGNDGDAPNSQGNLFQRVAYLLHPDRHTYDFAPRADFSVGTGLDYDFGDNFTDDVNLNFGVFR